MISIIHHQEIARTFLCQCICIFGSLSISAEPMRLIMQGLGFLDPLPSHFRRVIDEMVDAGWIAKSTYHLTPPYQSIPCTPRGPLVSACPPTLVGTMIPVVRSYPCLLG